MKKLLRKKQSGFSLLELLIVSGIILLIGMIKVQSLQGEMLDFQAKTIADQIKTVGGATNAYINLNYDKLIKMDNVTAGNGAPLTCDKGKKTCEISIETLKNSFLLPETFSGKNLFDIGYKINLKIDGTAPNYQVNGLVVTDEAIKSKVGYDAFVLLGKATQFGGIDAGFSKNNNTVNGLGGAWSQNSTKYPNINKTGLLAYQVGYSANMYSVYLRRDGTLPMTGNLNLDEHDINNIANAFVHKNLSVDGTANVKGDITSDKVVRAKAYFEGFNGVGDRFRVGGSDGNDYEFALYNNTKPLTILRPNAGGSSNTVLQTMGGIHAANGGSIVATGNVSADNRVKAGEYIQLDGKAVIGGTCENDGLIAKNNEGKLLSCYNKVWSNASGDFPIGSPIPWPSSNAPKDWLVANGQTFNKAAYPKLAEIYPSGRLPDLRGTFIRGWDAGKGVDKGRALMSEQGDAIRNIKGTVRGYNYEYGNAGYTGVFKVTRTVNGRVKRGNSDDWIKEATFDASTVVPKADENRPKNIAFNYIIKAR